MGSVCSSRDKNEPERPQLPAQAHASAKQRLIDRLGEGEEDDGSMYDDSETFSRSFAKMNPAKIDTVYDVDFLQKQLGEGAYGTVRVGRHRAIGVERAVKSISRDKLKGKALKAFQKEMAIMKAVDHPNIVKLYETFQDAKFVYLVMEMCTGGELFDKIVEDGPQGFPEEKAATYVQQILALLVYLHKLGIVHRDLKPENFLMQDKSQDAELKLIDFGTSKWYKGKPMKLKVGSSFYMAPEVINGRYDLKCDVWSCGIMAYVLLCGYPPFVGNTDRAIITNVQKQKLDFPSEDWGRISLEAKDFVAKLLTKDPTLRPNANDMFQHNWIKSYGSTRKIKGKTQASRLSMQCQAFNQAQQFKRVCLTLIATQLKDQDIVELRQLFRGMDKDGDGSISQQELLKAVKKLGLGKEEIDALMSIDSDGSGQIEYTEFLAALIDRQTYQRRDVAWAAFRTFDKDGDGVITMQELQQVMGQDDKSLSAAKVQSLIAEVDKNGDGVVDFEEFMAMLAK